MVLPKLMLILYREYNFSPDKLTVELMSVWNNDLYPGMPIECYEYWEMLLRIGIDYWTSKYTANIWYGNGYRIFLCSRFLAIFLHWLQGISVRKFSVKSWIRNRLPVVTVMVVLKTNTTYAVKQAVGCRINLHWLLSSVVIYYARCGASCKQTQQPLKELPVNLKLILFDDGVLHLHSVQSFTLLIVHSRGCLCRQNQ